MTTQGLVNFMTPGNSIALIDYWRNWGVDLTREEAALVCLTRCEQNEACKVVHTRTFEADFPGLKLRHTCRMFNPELGVDTAFQYPNPGFDIEMDIFTKRSAGVRIPEYKSCDIPYYSDLVKAVGCLECFPEPPVGYEDFCATTCPPLLTSDFLTYMEPAVRCVAQEGGGDAAVDPCLGCLMSKLTGTRNKIAASICLTEPKYSMVRGDCGSVCFENVMAGLDLRKCEIALQSALLCSLGSRPEVKDGSVYGGAITYPYTCPDVEEM